MLKCIKRLDKLRNVEIRFVWHKKIQQFDAMPLVRKCLNHRCHLSFVVQGLIKFLIDDKSAQNGLKSGITINRIIEITLLSYLPLEAIRPALVRVVYLNVSLSGFDCTAIGGFSSGGADDKLPVIVTDAVANSHDRKIEEM